jgi:hypothetical protein
VGDERDENKLKRVSLYPLSFTEAIAALVKVKPAADDEERVDEKETAAEAAEGR